MLTISRALYEKIIEHARKDHPDEACGIIAGPEGSDTPAPVHPDAERRALAHLLPVRLA